MSKFLLHSLFLFIALILAFYWTSNPFLSFYNLQLIGLLVLFFFLNQIFNRQRKRKALILDTIILTLIVFLLVFSTGGLSSPLFFLIYFLIFGLSLIFEPLVSFSLTLALVFLFAFGSWQEDFLSKTVQLFSLILTTPLAVFLGNQYLKVLVDEEKIKILKEEEKILLEQIKKEETDTLLWTTLDFKKTIRFILEKINELLSSPSSLTANQKETLFKIRKTLLELLQSGNKLKEEIDKTTDES